MAHKESGLNLASVVYATDFSICSQNAGLYAALLAKHFSAKLFVAHAFTLSQAAMEVEIDGSLMSQQRKDLQFLLSQKASMLSDESTQAVPILLNGDPRTAIPSLADQNAPSLIALGTHGRNWLDRDLLGSAADGILRSTSWPCLTVGPHVQSVSSRDAPFRRILYATDLSPASAGAAAYVASFAETFGSDIDVLHVVPGAAVDHPEALKELDEYFYRILEDVVPQAAGKFHHPRTFVEAGDAHDKILEHIQEQSIDLLFLGVGKTSHLSLAARKSGAFSIVIHARCPVLTIAG